MRRCFHVKGGAFTPQHVETVIGNNATVWAASAKLPDMLSSLARGEGADGQVTPCCTGATSPDDADVVTVDMGSHVVRQRKSSLTFPEPNQQKMIYRVTLLIEIRSETRFVNFSSRWTGRGVMSPPQLQARIVQEDTTLGPNFPWEPAEADEISARRHGPMYRDMARKSYIIDLGKRLGPGTWLEFYSETEFVDEAGTFEPYLISGVTRGRTCEELAVGFTVDESNASVFEYQFRNNRTAPWSTKEDVKLDVKETTDSRGERLIYHSLSLGAEDLGFHKIVWNPKERV